MTNCLPDELKLFFDGSCLPKNPGGVAAYGWRILDKDNQEIATDNQEVCRGPEATNNLAEWAGVTNGLRFLKKNHWNGKLEIYGDSELVIKQLNGVYRVKKDTLIPYFKESIELLSLWSWKASWIPREQNEHCDMLSKRKC